MLPSELLAEGEHLMTVCNSCRYCEGFCAVWKAMETRLEFKENDLNYLANLCHNCGECFYACQYSPPHEFAINPPQTLAKIRVHSYEQYAWPRPLAKAFRWNGLLVSLVMVVVLTGFMMAASLTLRGRLFEAVRGGNFYAIVPHAVMTLTFMAVGLFAMAALIVGFLRFWKNVGESYATLAKPGALATAFKDIFSLVNLDNGGDGCSYPTEKSSESLRWLHHATFYGFLSCFVATSLGFVYYYVFGEHGPPGYTSLPVIFGSVGGIGLVIGPLGLWGLMQRRNPDLVDKKQTGMDLSFILLLILVSVTGLLLLVSRESAAMGTLLIVHLSMVMTLFITMPYGKFVHGIYRSGALLKWALERSRSVSSGSAT
jgi:citrate/tricarballylate utilization protein